MHFLLFSIICTKLTKINFAMETADQKKGLEFPDVRIKCVEDILSVDVFAKPTNCFTYEKTSTCIHLRI